jgi:four helix bundle protein
MQDAGGREGIPSFGRKGCRMPERTEIRNYRDLSVWQLRMDIAVRVYEITRDFAADEKFGLTSQLRRAAASVPANIAEGHARSTTKDYLRYIAIAIGSLAEAATFIELAGRLGYGDVDELRKVYEITTEERRMLRSLQKSLRRRLPPN